VGTTIEGTPEFASNGIYAVYYAPGDDLLRFHTHEFLECFLVISGEGRHRTGKNHLDLKAGDLVFLNVTQPHSIEPLSGDFTVAMVVFLPRVIGIADTVLENSERLKYFAFLSPFINEKNCNGCLLLALSEHEQHIFSLFFLHMAELQYNPSERSKEMMINNLKNILLSANMLAGQKIRIGNVNFQSAFDYINQHFKEEIVLDAIAKAAGISPSYFSSLFNKVTGKSIRSYINELRISAACELLCESSLNISNIAYTVGYENVTHFNRLFKKITRFSPKQIRRNGKPF